MSRPGLAGRLARWLDERYEITPLVDFLRHKEVPIGAHSLVWYYLGGTTLFFFSVQIATGVLLLMYYEPGEATSYESLRYITTKVPFGWLVRSVHCWSAHLMIVSLVAHMFSTMMLKAYRPPRELTWVTGYALFAISLGFGFSGYLLPWNELSFFATAVGTDSVKSVPLVGDWVLQVLRGGRDVTISTLYRFFAFHVVVLPLACVGLIALHLLFVQRQGMAAPVGTTHAPRGMPFFPNFALRDLLLWLGCFLLLLVLATLLPYGPGIPGMEWELGRKADPLAPAYPGIKPEWYFLWVYQLLKEFPPHLLGMEGPQACLLVVGVLLAIWGLVPWLDRAARRNEHSPAFSDFGFAAIYFLSFLTLKAWDIGVSATTPDAEAAAVSARLAAWWVLGLSATVTVVRAWKYQHRWFLFTVASALHAALHGLAGVSYLASGAIALAILAAAAARAWIGLSLSAVAVMWAGTGDLAAAASLQAFLDANDANGATIIDSRQREYLAGLPEHARTLLDNALGQDLIGSAGQLADILSLQMPAQRLELVLQDNCVLCHSNPDFHDPASLFSTNPIERGSPAYMNLRALINDVHLRHGLGCSGCHGGDSKGFMAHDHPPQWPDDRERRQRDRTWIPGFCARCHSDAAYMRRFDPALPTDQLSKYESSHHGRLLLEKKDSRAAQCVSCHGNHGIQGADSPLSKIYPLNVPETCGHCHSDAKLMAGLTLDDGTPIPTNQLDEYRASVHGRALLERRDTGAPACNDCHGNHAAIPPDVASVAQICRTCHIANGTLFDGSRHKQVFEEHGWPECGTCHGEHAIEKTSDAMLAPQPGTVCVDCHARHATGNPTCSATATYFHETITELATTLAHYTEQTETLAERGLDVEPLTNGLIGLEDSLRQARSYIHSFERSDFDQAVAPGRDLQTAISKLAEDAEAEYRDRRIGLLLSAGLVALLGVLLYLKLRDIERAPGT